MATADCCAADVNCRIGAQNKTGGFGFAEPPVCDAIASSVSFLNFLDCRPLADDRAAFRFEFRSPSVKFRVCFEEAQPSD
jgi:hypothetical protein